MRMQLTRQVKVVVAAMQLVTCRTKASGSSATSHWCSLIRALCSKNHTHTGKGFSNRVSDAWLGE
eukprot:3211481-Amphidinium_carterae.1